NVQVDTGSCGGTVFVANSTTAASFTVTGLTNGQQYYWRVASVGAGGTSAFSSCFSFSVNGPPPVPTLLSPANGTVLPTGTTSENLTWAAPSGATGYNVEAWTGSCGG